MHLTDNVFELTDTYPKEQLYVLVSQMQRAAVSIPSNIAEGRARHSKKDFAYHLNVAQGSLSELETQIMLSHRRKYITDVQLNNILKQSEEIMKMLHGLKATLMNS